MLNETKKSFIEFMIDCDVLKFGEFITKSSRKTPYFINTGNFKTGKQLKILGNFYAEIINEYKNEIDVLFGPAYKGIPLAVCCAEAMFNNFNIEMPFLFNRKETKDHGEKGNFVGYEPSPSEKIAIVEDVLTAGTAVSEVIPKLKTKFKTTVNHMFIAVDRCEKITSSQTLARKALKEKLQIEVHSIVDIFDIRNFIQDKHEFKKYIEKMDVYINTYSII